jgi:hypothetical protein
MGGIQEREGEERRDVVKKEKEESVEERKSESGERSRCDFIIITVATKTFPLFPYIKTIHSRGPYLYPLGPSRPKTKVQEICSHGWFL